MSDPTLEYSADYTFSPRPYRHFTKILDDIKSAFARRAVEFNFRVSQICPTYGSGELADHIIGVRVLGRPFESASNPKSKNRPLLPPEDMVAALVTRSLQDLVNREPTREDRIRKIEDFSTNDDGEETGARTALTPDDPDISAKQPRAAEPTGLATVIDVCRGRLSVDNVWVALDSQVAEIFSHHLNAFRFSPNPGQRPSRKHMNLEETRAFLDALAGAVSAAQRHLEEPFAT